MNVVPPSFAAGNKQPQQYNGLSPGMPTIRFSSQFRRAGYNKKLHRFAATTGSLWRFLIAVFIITFSFIEFIEISKTN